MNKEVSLYNILWGALSPYAFDILRLALAGTLFSKSLKILRSKNGHTSGGNAYADVTTAFIGYLLGRGIPISINLIDRVCNEVLAKMSK